MVPNIISHSKVIIWGAKGNLGNAFVKALSGKCEVFEVTKRDLPKITHESIDKIIAKIQPAVLINCSGHTNAEVGENDQDISFLTNSLLPSLIANGCRKYNVRLVHFSSTGVYGKYKKEPYNEFDKCVPTTVHHKSKLAGESLINEAVDNALILRTGWLFGGEPEHNKSFVWDRIQESIGKDELLSDPTQFGNPTWVDDVVSQTISLINSDVNGTYNCVSHPPCRRIDYVSEIMKAASIDIEVNEADKDKFKRIAPVSWNEMAENYKLKLLGINAMPDWRISMKKYVSSLVNKI